MTTGVFHMPGKTGGGRYSLAAHNERVHRDRLFAFSDALASGLSVHDAAVSIGVHPDRGKKYFREIRKALGWQSV